MFLHWLMSQLSGVHHFWFSWPPPFFQKGWVRCKLIFKMCCKHSIRTDLELYISSRGLGNSPELNFYTIFTEQLIIFSRARATFQVYPVDVRIAQLLRYPWPRLVEVPRKAYESAVVLDLEDVITLPWQRIQLRYQALLTLSLRGLLLFSGLFMVIWLESPSMSSHRTCQASPSLAPVSITNWTKWPLSTGKGVDQQINVILLRNVRWPYHPAVLRLQPF